MPTSDITEGLIALLADVSHDPDEQDWYDVHEYLDLIPNTNRVLREFALYVHENYL